MTWAQGCIRWSTYTLHGAMCRYHVQTLLLLPVPQKCPLHFSLFLSLVCSLFQLCTPTVTFSPLLLLCLLLLEKTFVQVQAVKGPRSHSVSLSREGF